MTLGVFLKMVSLGVSAMSELSKFVGSQSSDVSDKTKQLQFLQALQKIEGEKYNFQNYRKAVAKEGKFVVDLKNFML